LSNLFFFSLSFFLSRCHLLPAGRRGDRTGSASSALAPVTAAEPSHGRGQRLVTPLGHRRA